MNNVFEIAGRMLLSGVGVGTIVLGLSGWLGKVWANRITEKEKANFAKELQVSSDLRKMKIEYYHTFVQIFSIQCKPQDEKKNAGQKENSSKFAIECNRLCIYASKEVVEFIEKVKTDPSSSNPSDLLKLIRKDLYGVDEEIECTFMI